MRPGRRTSLLLALGSLALAVALAVRAAREGARGSLFERLAGPFAGLAASVQWVRVDAALRESRFPLAYQRAETALALAPGDPQGWIFYAQQLLFQRTALARGGSEEEWRAWAQAGMDVLARAERECADPAQVWVYEGSVFAAWAELDDADRPWPGGARAAWERARAAFVRARELGHPLGALLEARAQDRLDELPR